MEVKENDKTWRMSPDSESSWTTDAEASSGKKFTIPKIRRTTEKGKSLYKMRTFVKTLFLWFISVHSDYIKLDQIKSSFPD